MSSVVSVCFFSFTPGIPVCDTAIIIIMVTTLVGGATYVFLSIAAFSVCMAEHQIKILWLIACLYPQENNIYFIKVSVALSCKQ